MSRIANPALMNLDDAHARALDRAETWMFHSNFCPYLDLKDLFRGHDPSAPERFKKLFAEFYALNTGGLTDEFKDAFFEMLFNEPLGPSGRVDIRSVLGRLSLIKRRKGDYALPLSFASKLAAMRCEASPIYDRHVAAFFSESAPAASVAKETRIDWFVSFLEQVERSYRAWAVDPRIAPVLQRLKARDPRLADCDDVRLIDFLVWKAGNQRLLT